MRPQISAQKSPFADLPPSLPTPLSLSPTLCSINVQQYNVDFTCVAFNRSGTDTVPSLSFLRHTLSTSGGEKCSKDAKQLLAVCQIWFVIHQILLKWQGRGVVRRWRCLTNSTVQPVALGETRGNRKYFQQGTCCKYLKSVDVKEGLRVA